MYVDVRDLIPDDTLTPLVKYIQLTHYVNTNIFHDQITDRSITGILHLDKKTQCIGIIINRVLCRYPRMVLGLFLPIPLGRRLLIFEIPFDTLVHPITRKATCLEVKNLFLTVPSTRITICISATLYYPFIESGRLLYIIWLSSTIYLGETTQLKSYQSIGSNVIFGGFFSN